MLDLDGWHRNHRGHAAAKTRQAVERALALDLIVGTSRRVRFTAE
jgi:hypothetical protein